MNKVNKVSIYKQTNDEVYTCATYMSTITPMPTQVVITQITTFPLQREIPCNRQCNLTCPCRDPGYTHQHVHVLSQHQSAYI